MSKLVILSGLPASGKSTKCKEYLANGNTIRVNKDLMREMLHDGKFNGANESMTRDAVRLLAKHFLKEGKTVLCDDTNLNKGTLQSWVDLARECDAKIQYERIDTPVDECIARDLNRSAKGERYVGKHVIQKMALQYLGYMEGENVILCDLDGTMCKIDHRLKYAKGEEKDWKKFFSLLSEDTLREDVRQQLWDRVEATGKEAGTRTKIIFVSARPETCRYDTQIWLDAHYRGPYEALIMREANDKRDDTEVKSDMYKKYLSKLNIMAVYDDRPRVIRMWRELGLAVVDVGPGIDF